MKFLFSTYRQSVVASFGRARLVRNVRGQYELHGGSRSDQTEAKEWISLFLHDAVLAVAPGNIGQRH